MYNCSLLQASLFLRVKNIDESQVIIKVLYQF